MNEIVLMLLFACAGVVLALALRRPLRRLAGAGPAFFLWLLPPLLALVACLPAWPSTLSSVNPIPILPGFLVTPHAVSTTPDAAGIGLAHGLFAIWILGVLVMLTRLGLHCVYLVRHSAALPQAMRAILAGHVGKLAPGDIRVHPAGPAVCWIPGHRLLLPADLEQSFTEPQRAQVLAHERMHLARLDPWWSLGAELALAALWFFPPAWMAMGCFRLDQELACDAAILRAAPAQASCYARALLSGIDAPQTMAATSPWLARSQLKERLTMIRNHSRTLVPRRSGYALMVTLLCGLAMTAHAALPVALDTTKQNTTATAPPSPPAPPPPSPPSPPPKPPAPPMPPPPPPPPAPPAAGAEMPIAGVVLPSGKRNNPVYPEEALKNGEEGTVMLMILVGADGLPQAVTYDKAATNASNSLVNSAIATATQWRYESNASVKAIEQWYRLPIVFSLDSVAPGNHLPEHP